MAPHRDNKHTGLARVCSYLAVRRLEVTSDRHKFLGKPGGHQPEEGHPGIQIARPMARRCRRKGVLPAQKGIIDATHSRLLATMLFTDHKPG